MGERSSQNELYNLFAPKMFTVCLRYGKDSYESKEMLQEGFIKVFSSLYQYRNEGSLEGWIRQVIITTALQHLRKRTSLHAILSVEGNVENQLQEKENIESSLSSKELLAFVQALPATYRMVFNLYVFEDYSHKEIAKMLGITEGTSRSNLHDARQWLKEKITAANCLQNIQKKCL